MKHYSRLSSIVLLLFFAACTSPYKHLKKAGNPAHSAFIYKPSFDKVLYRCTVNGRIIFKKFHLSGVLFFKTLETGTVRAIFQNEMGFTFFDFEWDKQDSFRVNGIIPQLDKPALVKTLKKDMNLLLMKGLDRKSEVFFKSDRGNEGFYCLSLEKGVVYYIEKDDQLIRIENAGGEKKVVTIKLGRKNTATAMPESVFFNHHKANFTIELNKIEQDVNE